MTVSSLSTLYVSTLQITAFPRDLNFLGLVPFNRTVSALEGMLNTCEDGNVSLLKRIIRVSILLTLECSRDKRIFPSSLYSRSSWRRFTKT